jgi:membrane protease YdiL (CAAX protease family)
LLNQIIGGYVIIVFILFIAAAFGCFKTFGFKKENLVKGLLYGSPAIIGLIYTLTISLSQIDKSKLIFPSTFKITVFNFHMFGIGLFEEIFYRGTVLNIMKYTCKEKGRDVLKVIILSSLLFGSMHFIAITDKPDILTGVLSQFFYTTVMGIFLSVIYLKFKNIWSIIIIHSLFDWMGLFTFIFLPIDYRLIIQDTLSFHARPVIALMDCIVSIPFLFYALFLFKRFDLSAVSKDEQLYSI